VTTGLVVVVVGATAVVVVVVVAEVPGVVVGDAGIMGLLGNTVDPAVLGCGGGAGAAPPGCSAATTTPIQAVAPPAASTIDPVRNRMRTCARSRTRAACGRRIRRTDSGWPDPWTREGNGLMGVSDVMKRT
jgi:hypothetical protein